MVSLVGVIYVPHDKDARHVPAPKIIWLHVCFAEDPISWARLLWEASVTTAIIIAFIRADMPRSHLLLSSFLIRLVAQFVIRCCAGFARFRSSSLESLVLPRVYGEPCNSAGVESAPFPFKGSDACVSRSSLDVCCLTCSTVAYVPSDVMLHCANLDGCNRVHGADTVC